MLIRPAAPSDFEAYTALFLEINDYHAEAVPHIFRSIRTPPRSRDEYEAILEDPTQAIFVAEVDGAVAAYLHLVLREAFAHPIMVPRRYVVVDTVTVAAAHRRQGIARALMALAEDWARDQGADAIELNVWDFNGPARAMYAELGYSPLSHKLGKKI